MFVYTIMKKTCQTYQDSARFFNFCPFIFLINGFLCFLDFFACHKPYAFLMVII